MRNHKKYNSMQSDIRFRKINYEMAEAFIHQLKDKWIYIKQRCSNYNVESNFISGLYSKFKVKTVYIDDSSIYIYGFEDEDTLAISKERIVQTEITFENDELRIVVCEGSINYEVYMKLYLPNASKRYEEVNNSTKNLVITEGKSDWKHLKNALNEFRKQDMYKELDIEFFEFEENVKMGNDRLKKLCEYQALLENPALRIFLFDSDDVSINILHKDSNFINHGNNVYSMILPIPNDKIETPLISIENYYDDEHVKELHFKDRRLYYAHEFDYITGKHLSLDKVYTLSVSENTQKNHIVDDKVYYLKSEVQDKSLIHNLPLKKSISLSKNEFASLILRRERPFDSLKIDNFSLIFDEFVKIFNDYSLSNIYANRTINEISHGVFLESCENGLLVLAINAGIPDFRLANSALSINIDYDDSNLNFNIKFIDSLKEFKISIKRSEELLDFIYKKSFNRFNRIEIYFYDNEGKFIGSREIFKDELSSNYLGMVHQDILAN